MNLQQSTKNNFVKSCVSMAFCLLLSTPVFSVEGGTHQAYLEGVDNVNLIDINGNAYRLISNDLVQTYVQNNTRRPVKRVRSQSEVVREVKQDYNAEVLKITLNQEGSAYHVRILMPSGRVKQITVGATQ